MAKSEHPIIFIAPMVRAILAGSKTQTRRLVRGEALEWLAPGMFSPAFVALPENNLCPYGFQGGRLWVRETWCPEYESEGNYLYRADPSCELTIFPDGGHWRSPSFMPREASRITMLVEDVRVQRLQDISEEDAQAEGVELHPESSATTPHRSAFIRLWEQINAKRAPWGSNPWVWAITFTRMP